MQGFARRCSLCACLQIGMDTTQRTGRESPSRWSLSVSSFSLSSYILETETRMDRLQVPAGPVVRVPDCIQATWSLLFQKMSSFLVKNVRCLWQTNRSLGHWAWDTEPPNYLSSTHGSRSRSFLQIRAGQMLTFKILTLLKPEKKHPLVFFFIA